MWNMEICVNSKAHAKSVARLFKSDNKLAEQKATWYYKQATIDFLWWIVLQIGKYMTAAALATIISHIIIQKNTHTEQTGLDINRCRFSYKNRIFVVVAFSQKRITYVMPWWCDRLTARGLSFGLSEIYPICI